MYIQMKKTGLDVADLIVLTKRKKDGVSVFPYQPFVCRCGNCLYSCKGKCALKECCCLEERIRAHTCTFGELMKYCFADIGDNVFHFRLRIAIEREAEMKSCFLNAGHRKCFMVDTFALGRAKEYLLSRGIDEGIIDECVARNMIAENVKTGTVMFLGYYEKAAWTNRAHTSMFSL